MFHQNIREKRFKLFIERNGLKKPGTLFIFNTIFDKQVIRTKKQKGLDFLW